MNPLFILLLFCGTVFSREPAVSGQFYPSDKKELQNIIEYYFKNVEPLPKPEGTVLGLIVPHAGYVFSGQTAAYGYKYLSTYNLKNPIIILIGQSHHYFLEKPSVYKESNFKTPLGEVLLEKNFISQLVTNGKNIFTTNPQPHIPEHSLEVQLPFLQYIYPEFTLVPILVSSYDYDKSYQIAKTIFYTIKNYPTNRPVVIICSTDLSHYPKYFDAVNVDQQTINLIQTLDAKKYYQQLPKIQNQKIENFSCALCGDTAVGITLILTNLLETNETKILNYSNSAYNKTYGDKSRVVGYVAIAFIKNPNTTKKEKLFMENTNDTFKISEKNQKILLTLARKTISQYLSTGKRLDFTTEDKELLQPAAVFVTLTKNHQLRGCIGTTVPQLPLYKAVIDMSIAAATQDPRFNRLTLDELEKVKIEISVLSPIKKVSSPTEIKENVHGVIVKRGFNSGLFLPQVWQQIPNKEEFLSELCWSKAGLSPDAWKDPKTELYIFTVFAFEEH
jgi:AmmeMemoRadiSam system protein B/AmmeMemoRadiSam system protein A